jgi:hypothetical protein
VIVWACEKQDESDTLASSQQRKGVSSSTGFADLTVLLRRQ